MMYAYRHPDRLASTHDWIQWVFRLRRRDRRHALEFVEGWNTTRIAVSGTVPWLASCLVGILWSAMGGDPQTAFTVASFILTSSSGMSFLSFLIYLDNEPCGSMLLTGSSSSHIGAAGHHQQY
jgi:hypothetical protein